MRIVKYHYHEQVQYGLSQGDQLFPIEGDIFGHYQVTEIALPIQTVTLLPPNTGGQLYAIGLNYRDHVGELAFAQNLPTEPISFIVSTHAITGPNQPIFLNNPHQRIDEEAELVVIIGKTCHQVPEAHALDYVFGYTCGNDVSNRDIQAQDGQWLRGKSYPSYKPLGPWIETAIDPSNLEITARLNGKVVQQSNTQHLLFSVPQLIAFLSSFTVLQPGDMIMTGTPKGVSQLKSGDTIEIHIQGIGTLVNSVE